MGVRFQLHFDVAFIFFSFSFSFFIPSCALKNKKKNFLLKNFLKGVAYSKKKFLARRGCLFQKKNFWLEGVAYFKKFLPVI